jgi:hypothetical protein
MELYLISIHNYFNFYHISHGYVLFALYFRLGLIHQRAP